MPSTYIHTEIGEAESSQDTVLRNTTPAKKRRKPASTRRGTVSTSKKRKLNVCQKHFQFTLRGRELNDMQYSIVNQLDQTEQLSKEVMTERQRNDELLPLIEEMKIAARDVTDAKQKISLAGSTELPSQEVDDLIGEDPDSQWTTLQSIQKQKSGKILHLLHKSNVVRSTITNLNVDLQEARHGLEIAKTEYDAEKEAEIKENLRDASKIHDTTIAALHEEHQRKMQETSLSKKKLIDDLIKNEREGFETKLTAEKEKHDKKYESAVRRHQTELDRAKLAAKDKDRYCKERNAAQKESKDCIERCKISQRKMQTRWEEESARSRAREESLQSEIRGWEKYGKLTADQQQEVKVATDHLTEANARVNTLDGQLRDARTEISSMSTQIVDLQSTVSTQNLNIRALDAAKSEVDAQIRVQAEELKQTKRRSEDEFRGLEMELGRQAIANIDICRFMDDAIVELKNDVCSRDRQLSDLESAKSKVDAQLKSKAEEFAKLSDTTSSKDNTIRQQESVKIKADTALEEQSRQITSLRDDISSKNVLISELESAKSKVDLGLKIKSEEFNTLSDITSSKDDTICQLESARITADALLEAQDRQIQFLQSDDSSKKKEISDLRCAKSDVELQLKSKSEEVFTQSNLISSRDAEISELMVAVDTQIGERKKQVDFLEADVLTGRKRIIELEQAKDVLAEQLAGKVDTLGQRESEVSEQARLIEELEKSKSHEILKGQEASDQSANLQLILNDANDRVNRLSIELHGAQEDASAAKSKHLAEISTAYARLKDLATEVKARDITLQEKEILAQTRTQRIDELEQEAKRDADQAFNKRTMLETGLEDRERQLTKERQLTASLQARINQLESAQAQSVEAQKESERKADDVRFELRTTQREARGSETRLRAASSALAETKSILEESTTDCTRLSLELTNQTSLAREFKQEMTAEKSQLLADVEDIWVCKGDYQGVAVTVRIYRSTSQQRIVVVLYQGDRRTFLWRGSLHQCALEGRGWDTGLCMSGNDQGSPIWVRLISDKLALGNWLAMEGTGVLNGIARLSLE